MESPNKGKHDPDYASISDCLHTNEAEEATDQIKKLSNIIREEFDNDLAQSEKQLEEIERDITTCRKLFISLKKIIVADFYNKRKLQCDDGDLYCTTALNSDADNYNGGATIDIQNRIHPAVKKLVGKHPTNFDFLKARSKRKCNVANSNNSSNNNNASNSKIKTENVESQDACVKFENKRIKLDPGCLKQEPEDGERQQQSLMVKAEPPPAGCQEYSNLPGASKSGFDSPQDNDGFTRYNPDEAARSFRGKTWHRIIIGNISKWCPSSEDDNLTYKWMIYLRGPTEALDVSRFIQKVTFYLHPSYKPFDVVEVSDPPFQLSRRGWGEFPVRVQIFFKITLNKPKDVIHNLTLDKKRTGRQTKAEETIVDLLLYNTYEPEPISPEKKEQSHSSSNSNNDHQKSHLIADTKPNVDLNSYHFAERKPVLSDSSMRTIKPVPDNSIVDVTGDSHVTIKHENPPNNRLKIVGNVGTKEIAEEAPSTSSKGFEHNYCYEKNAAKVLTKNQQQKSPSCVSVMADHTYYSSESPDINKAASKLQVDRIAEREQQMLNNPVDNKLIYGLDESYCDASHEQKQNCSDLLMVARKPPAIEPIAIKNQEPKQQQQHSTYVIRLENLNNFLQLSRKDITFSNKKIFVFGNELVRQNHHSHQHQGVQQKSSSGNNNNSKQHCFKVPSLSHVSLINKNETSGFRVTLPKNKFKNVGEAMPYLFRKLPLVSDLAANMNYKHLYPFTASSLKELLGWNWGKQRSAEWSRAKLIRNILVQEKIHEAHSMTTKSILMYGRSHGYTPTPPTYRLFVRDSLEKRSLMNCFATSDATVNRLNLDELIENDTSIINVDSDNDSNPKKSTTTYNKMVNVSDPKLRSECAFVKQTALDSGIVLKPEEIDEGTTMNSSERVIFEAVKCLADNIVRRALNHRICKGNFNPNTSMLSVEDVQAAIQERPEIAAISQFGSLRKQQEYFK